MEISESGQEALYKANEYCNLLESHWGDTDGIATEARRSLLTGVAAMMQLGGRWWKDGEMSLVGSTDPGLVVGLIPHFQKNKCQACDYWLGTHGGVFTYNAAAEAFRCEGEHDWSYDPKFPAPVTWSTHS